MPIKIRRMTDGDLQPLYKLLSSPKVMQFLEPPYSKAQTEQFLLQAGLSDPPLIYTVEKEHRFIGYVIYHDYDAEHIEIGWVLDPSYWGQGIASFLASQMIAKAEESGKHIVIECAPEQKSSIRIAEKYGFQNQGMRDGLIVFCR